ncbi:MULTISPECIES: TetR/AcrR family transcriptional regulator [Pseudonocardia]|uniref:TetR/AcrR family transcriptional regulator n=1 Tax=Pseudonocardia abyssalis TaxID=2792008 RepID=A0ABS6V1W6_9PSEU|nr:TetR/AcrR family transcriptional regulator [Pseudonocardia abyssalis]MBW0113711.1 TetR/AcrR family transcriptional regulator [Pseudonocardia abyssalis]MBW0138392.1 TetR/AcrR family transcriptional regulator [Pseudonocardia abyssalis]
MTGVRGAVGSAEQPTGGRVARRRDRKVQDILAAAAVVLAERGYHGLSLDEIAERLDLTKASLYHYFPSKEELVSSCLEQLGSSLNGELRDLVVAHPGTATEQLTLLITRQLELIVRTRPEMARLFLQPLDWPETYRRRTRRLREGHDAIFRAVVRRGIADGEFDVDEDVAMHNLYGAMNYVPVWFRGRRKRDFDAASAAVAANLLRLFRPGAGPGG